MLRCLILYLVYLTVCESFSMIILYPQVIISGYVQQIKDLEQEVPFLED